MHKLYAIILFGVASIGWVGCGSHNAPEDKQQELEQTNSEYTIKYYVNDSLLQYIHVTIIDSLHLDLGELPYSVTPLDTIDTDTDFWINILRRFYIADKALYHSIPISSIKVLNISHQQKSGSCKYRIQFTRNDTPSHSSTTTALLGMTYRSTVKQQSSQTQISTAKALNIENMMSYLRSKERALQIDIP